jgi:hypothetical protein
MKALNTAIVDGKNLTVLMDELPEDKASISYFIDGLEITCWDKIKPFYQNIFTVLADDVCKGYCLTKWSY